MGARIRSEHRRHHLATPHAVCATHSTDGRERLRCRTIATGRRRHDTQCKCAPLSRVGRRREARFAGTPRICNSGRYARMRPQQRAPVTTVAQSHQDARCGVRASRACKRASDRCENFHFSLGLHRNEYASAANAASRGEEADEEDQYACRHIPRVNRVPATCPVL